MRPARKITTSLDEFQLSCLLAVIQHFPRNEAAEIATYAEALMVYDKLWEAYNGRI